jgi:hypothetical protein
MAVFQGGRIPLIGVPTRDVTQPLVAGSVAAAGVGVTNPVTQQAISQFGTPAVNVALGALLGNEVSQAMGVDISAGAQVLSTQIGPFVSSAAAGAVSESVRNALQGSGLAGQFIGLAAGQATFALTQGIYDTLLGGPISGLLGGLTGTGIWNGVGVPTQQWPGAANEPPANYNQSAYSLGSGGPDVVFSIQPANQGPQAFGLASIELPETVTSMPLNSFTEKIPNYAGKAYDAAFSTKLDSMGFNFNSVQFDASSLQLGGTNGFNIQ